MVLTSTPEGEPRPPGDSERDFARTVEAALRLQEAVDAAHTAAAAPEPWLQGLAAQRHSLVDAIWWLGEHGPAERGQYLVDQLTRVWTDAARTRGWTERTLMRRYPVVQALREACVRFPIRVKARRRRAAALARDATSHLRAGRALRAASLYSLALFYYIRLEDHEDALRCTHGIQAAGEQMG